MLDIIEASCSCPGKNYIHTYPQLMMDNTPFPTDAGLGKRHLSNDVFFFWYKRKPLLIITDHIFYLRGSTSGLVRGDDLMHANTVATLIIAWLLLHFSSPPNADSFWEKN